MNVQLTYRQQRSYIISFDMQHCQSAQFRNFFLNHAFVSLFLHIQWILSPQLPKKIYHVNQRQNSRKHGTHQGNYNMHVFKTSSLHTINLHDIQRKYNYPDDITKIITLLFSISIPPLILHKITNFVPKGNLASNTIQEVISWAWYFLETHHKNLGRTLSWVFNGKSEEIASPLS